MVFGEFTSIKGSVGKSVGIVASHAIKRNVKHALQFMHGSS